MQLCFLFELAELEVMVEAAHFLVRVEVVASKLLRLESISKPFPMNVHKPYYGSYRICYELFELCLPMLCLFYCSGFPIIA